MSGGTVEQDHDARLEVASGIISPPSGISRDATTMPVFGSMSQYGDGTWCSGSRTSQWPPYSACR
jgi:hypothetical protein